NDIHLPGVLNLIHVLVLISHAVAGKEYLSDWSWFDPSLFIPFMQHTILVNLALVLIDIIPGCCLKHGILKFDVDNFLAVFYSFSKFRILLLPLAQPLWCNPQVISYLLIRQAVSCPASNQYI